MKVVFLGRNVGYLSRYEDAVKELANQGHQFDLLYQEDIPQQSESESFEDRMHAQCPAVRIHRAPAREDDVWSDVGTSIRQLQDYVRYYRPQLLGAQAQRERIEVKLSKLQRLVVSVPAATGEIGRRMVDAALRRAESAVPINERVLDYLRNQQADLLIVTPLVELGSNQVDYIRAAKVLGMRTAFCVASWDNLTHKGAMRVLPDRVFVWNDAQKHEAIELHDVPPARVEVTGSQLFDWWFDREPSLGYVAFCSRIGLDSTKPYLTFLGSSKFISPNDSVLAVRWIRWVRSSSNPVLASAGILVRPHPKNLHQYYGADLTAFDNVKVWYPTAEGQEGLRNDYFDSIYHSAAVTGVNTSAMVEASIIGRSVCTVILPELEHSQTNCPHFQLLTTVNGGLLHVAHSVEEHLGHLANSLIYSGQTDEKSRRFAEGFVRPHGLKQPATPILCEAITRLGESANPRQPNVSPSYPLTRNSLYSVAVVIRSVPAMELRDLWVYPIRLFLWLAARVEPLIHAPKHLHKQFLTILPGARFFRIYKRVIKLFRESFLRYRRHYRVGLDRLFKMRKRMLGRPRRVIRRLFTQKSHRHNSVVPGWSTVLMIRNRLRLRSRIRAWLGFGVKAGRRAASGDE